MNDSHRWNLIWNERKHDANWNSPQVDHNLLDHIKGKIYSSALEIGCGAGFNADYISKTCITDAIDVSNFAIAEARFKFKNVNFILDDFSTYDFLKKYDFIFDRGCFHGVFGGEGILERQWFVSKVNNLLTDNGQWLSIIGSPEGVTSENIGPPSHRLMDVVSCVDPILRILSIRATTILNKNGIHSPAWVMLSTKR